MNCFSCFSFEKKTQNQYGIYLLCFDININMTIKSVQITWTKCWTEWKRKERKTTLTPKWKNKSHNNLMHIWIRMMSLAHRTKSKSYTNQCNAMQCISISININIIELSVQFGWHCYALWWRGTSAAVELDAREHAINNILKPVLFLSFFLSL